jgi:hypothetical protein
MTRAYGVNDGIVRSFGWSFLLSRSSQQILILERARARIIIGLTTHESTSARRGLAHVEDSLALDADVIVTVFAQADNCRFSDNGQIHRLDFTLPSRKDCYGPVNNDASGDVGAHNPLFQ